MAKLSEDHPISAHKDVVGQVMHRWKHHDPKPLHSGRGKGGKEGKIVKSQDQAIAIALSMAGKSKDHAERLQAMGYSEQVAREVSSLLDGSYDFTTCERPNGSLYGTSGKCRKGAQVSPLQKQLDDLFRKESEARSKGDTETARKLMREHMNLTKKLDEEQKASMKGSKTSSQKSVQQIQLEKLYERLDDAVTIREQERISKAIKELGSRMGKK